MSLSFRQLQVIRAVIRAGSITGAADALGVSQPAVSLMVRQCRSTAGFPLFARRKGRLQPTPETAGLVADLDRVFDGVERINRLIDDMRVSNVGTIQIAATPTLAENLLPRAIAQFQKSRPNVRVTIHTMDNFSVIDHVAQEHVDFGLALSPFMHVDARQIELCAADLVCVVNPENPLARRGSVTPHDLSAVPLISFSKTLPLGMLVEAGFRKAGVALRVAHEVNQSSVACALVRAGAGAAIIDPFWLAESRDQRLVALKLRPRTEVTAEVLIPKAATPSRPARILLSTIENIVRELRQSGVVRVKRAIRAP
jgi:DNA-binding transcriptional LysR family regulator